MCFGCTRHPSSDFMFQKYREELVTVAVRTTVKNVGQDLALK